MWLLNRVWRKRPRDVANEEKKTLVDPKEELEFVAVMILLILTFALLKAHNRLLLRIC